MNAREIALAVVRDVFPIAGLECSGARRAGVARLPCAQSRCGPARPRLRDRIGVRCDQDAPHARLASRSANRCACRCAPARLFARYCVSPSTKSHTRAPTSTPPSSSGSISPSASVIAGSATSSTRFCVRFCAVRRPCRSASRSRTTTSISRSAIPCRPGSFANGVPSSARASKRCARAWTNPRARR